jgi:hypothetical protein
VPCRIIRPCGKHVEVVDVRPRWPKRERHLQRPTQPCAKRLVPAASVGSARGRSRTSQSRMPTMRRGCARKTQGASEREGRGAVRCEWPELVVHSDHLWACGKGPIRILRWLSDYDY